MALSFSDAKLIPIVDYLSKLGFEPDKVRGNDYWYRSPLRHERDASFKVNTKLNLWYDHGSGEGGTLLDLGTKLHQCSLWDFVKMLDQGNFALNVQTQATPSIKEEQRRISIIEVRDLTDQPLRDYLQSRSIDPNIYERYCKEVEFIISEKPYVAVGFQNRGGGFELRNSWFKGSSSPKDVSYFDSNSPKLCTVEGFTDFLSLFQIAEEEVKAMIKDSDFLVLNSISFLQRSLPILRSYHENFLMLDNDAPGRKAKQQLLELGVQFTDASKFYSTSKDINEHLMNHGKTVRTALKSKNLKLRS